MPAESGGFFSVGSSSVSRRLISPVLDRMDHAAMKTGLPTWLIAVLLLCLIGPAEELFWRGYVQRTMSRILGGKNPEDKAFIITAVIYALVHIWSFNFMLIMAALVAGLVWGLIYRLRPQALPALIVSHALWDALVFVILTI